MYDADLRLPNCYEDITERAIQQREGPRAPLNSTKFPEGEQDHEPWAKPTDRERHNIRPRRGRTSVRPAFHRLHPWPGVSTFWSAGFVLKRSNRDKKSGGFSKKRGLLYKMSFSFV